MNKKASELMQQWNLLRLAWLQGSLFGNAPVLARRKAVISNEDIGCGMHDICG